MSRADSPYVVGDYWLDKRSDGKSPDIWQIATRRSGHVVYRSTRQRSLDNAKMILDAVMVDEKTKTAKDNDEASVVSLLELYWLEHGRNVVSPQQIASSCRAFIGFLKSQEDLGEQATISMITPNVCERFRLWRMGPHSWDVWFDGKPSKITSAKGVKGESVQRNLDDVRAAFKHNERNGRIRAPYVPPVASQYRSPPKDRVLSLEELGAIFGYARLFRPLYQWLGLQLATAVRPEAALAFDPKKQVRGEAIDLHPPAWPQTKKINPVVPQIPGLKPILGDWKQEDVTTRRRSWNTMKRVLGLGPEVEAKTIRHTIATMLLDDDRITPAHIEALLGHRNMHRTTRVYAKWNIRHMRPLVDPLQDIWTAVHQEADRWGRSHSVATDKFGKLILL